VARRKRAFIHAFDGTPGVKDVIEALGVPHTEIDLILVDGKSVRFSHRLRGERVACIRCSNDSTFGRCIGCDPGRCAGRASWLTCISAASHAICACLIRHSVFNGPR
jgi:hypothetical protein